MFWLRTNIDKIHLMRRLARVVFLNIIHLSYNKRNLLIPHDVEKILLKESQIHKQKINLKTLKFRTVLRTRPADVFADSPVLWYIFPCCITFLLTAQFYSQNSQKWPKTVKMAKTAKNRFLTIFGDAKFIAWTGQFPPTGNQAKLGKCFLPRSEKKLMFRVHQSRIKRP